MDIKEYISSGAIESYVLGLSSADEMRETELMAQAHPEIRKAIQDFEIAIEKQAFQNEVEPSASLKQRIMEALQEEKKKDKGLLLVPPTETKAKVIPIGPAAKSVRWLQGAIAASIILLLGSAILNFYFYSKYKTFNGKYKELLAQNNTMIVKNQALQASYNMMRDTAMIQAPLEELQAHNDMFQDSTMRKVIMKGATDTKLGSTATVLWDSKTNDVYLVVNNLPKNPTDKQYQLWALVDGKPVDAGIVDISRPDGLLKMRNIPKAQAFAITLENKGGSPTPTMAQLFVIGKV